MAHGVSEVISDESSVKMVTAKQQQQQSQYSQQNVRKTVGVMGSRRIFAPAFKLKVLDSYRNDIDCRGNQRATARKYGIHRRQIQKWLQCEDNLRSSCAEIGTNVGSSVTGNSNGVLKPNGCLVESTGPGVSPASPALNLSLARLHGDELPVQQGPPPSHSPSRNSPLTSEYGFHVTFPLRVTPVGYTNYPNQDQHQFQELEEKIHMQEVHKYSGEGVESERKYYSLNPESYELDVSAGFDNRGEVKQQYQPLATYHSSPNYRYKTTDENGTDLHLHNVQHHQQSHQRNYEDVESSDDARISRTMLHAPVEIKTERASPDSAASPGLYEIPRSPGASTVSLSSSYPITITTTNSPTTHFEPPQPSSPLLHMHTREHSHPATLTDFEKPCYQMREKREAKLEGELELKGGEEEEEELKNEVEEEEERLEGETQELEVESKERESLRCIDYQRPPAASSLTNPESTSPLQEQPETYSGPPSPQDPGSSSRSSSCSENELDPVDYTSIYLNSSGELTRRRSFSLRFKLDVLDAFHRDIGVAGNQRATARKFGINRRQVQKWLGQEAELRGEILLRDGNSRQRLGPAQDVGSGEFPVDLRTTAVISTQPDADFDQTSPTLYCCEIAGSPATPSCQPRLLESPDASYRPCTFSCCTENTAIVSTTSCYQEVTSRRSCYAESQGNSYCYSPKESLEPMTLPGNQELISMKRSSCSLSCCYQVLPSSKRFCPETEENCFSLRQEQPPQETPLCLVKPKNICQTPVHQDPVISTLPAPVLPSARSSTKDTILFKPYLDNPISKPSNDSGYPGLSPVSSNNNNCQGICNLNEVREHDYALELSLRVPVSWRTQHSPYSDFPQVKSAFVRYPASPHYT